MQPMLRRMTALVLIAAVLLGALTSVERAAAGGNAGPRAMLQAYFNQYINMRNFWTAYQQWIAPVQTYTQFANGYADTAYVTAYFGGYQAGSVLTHDGSVPGILIGHRTNGTLVAYRGCYDLRFNPAESGLRQWLIAGADFEQMTYVPDETAILTGLLKFECSDYRKLATGTGYYNVQGLLSDYFEAVNNRDYAYAYGLWVNPAQSFDQFVTGWQDTTETIAFYGPYQFGGAFNAAETGRIPVMLLGYRTDGSLVSFQGCIGVTFNATLARHWSLYSAQLRQLPAGTIPSIAQINGALNAACY